NFRNRDGAVFVLIVFKQCSHRTADGKAAAVQSMEQFWLGSLIAFEFDVSAPRLEICHVGNRADFLVVAVARQPHFNVVCLGRAESDVPGTEQHSSMGDAEEVQYVFGMVGHLFQGIPGIFRAFETDHLHFVELVEADQPARILPAEPASLLKQAVWAVNLTGSSSSASVSSLWKLVSVTSDVGMVYISMSSTLKRSSSNLGSWPVENIASPRTICGVIISL